MSVSIYDSGFCLIFDYVRGHTVKISKKLSFSIYIFIYIAIKIYVRNYILEWKTLIYVIINQ